MANCYAEKGWPRRIINFPIVLIVTAQQLIWAVALAFDASAVNTTAVNVLYLIAKSVLPERLLVAAIIFSLVVISLVAVIGFFAPRRFTTALLLIPQQILLFFCAGAAFHAIWEGHFADGVQRSHAFLLVDQATLILIAFFHWWAMMLISIYSADRHRWNWKE